MGRTKGNRSRMSAALTAVGLALAFSLTGAFLALAIEEAAVDHSPPVVTVIAEPVSVIDYEPVAEELYTVNCIASKYYCDGTPYSDIIYGTDSANFIRGWGGHDKIIARGGNDIIVGGKGSDSAWGFPGKDRFRMAGCGSGRDYIHGGNGLDAAEVTLQDRWDDQTEIVSVHHCA